MDKQARMVTVTAFVTLAAASVFARSNVELLDASAAVGPSPSPGIALVARARLDEISRLSSERASVNVKSLTERAALDPESAYTLASYYWEMPNYSARAFRYMLMAAMNDHPEAAADLALMYAQGVGTKRDDLRARAWLQIAEARNSPIEITPKDLGLSDLIEEETDGLDQMVQALTSRST